MNIKVDTCGAAFHSEDDEVLDNYMMAEQLNAIFRSIIDKIRDGGNRGRELDVNGNIVCEWEV